MLHLQYYSVNLKYSAFENVIRCNFEIQDVDILASARKDIGYLFTHVSDRAL